MQPNDGSTNDCSILTLLLSGSLTAPEAITTFADRFLAKSIAQLKVGRIAAAVRVELLDKSSRLAQGVVGETPIEKCVLAGSGLDLQLRNLPRVLLLPGSTRDASWKKMRSMNEQCIVVGFDGQMSHIMRQDASGKSWHSSVPTSELLEDIGLLGSLLTVLSPSHRAILIRTYAVSLGSYASGPMFRFGPKRWIRSWRSFSAEARAQAGLSSVARFFTAGRRRGHPDYVLNELDKLFDTIGGNPTARVFQTEHGRSRLSKYAPPHSHLLRFENNSNAERSQPTRGDYVVEYRGRRSGRFFARDFVILPRVQSENDKVIYEAMADISNILAIRRSGLFQSALSRRVYTVVYPPGLVVLENPEPSVLITPCLVAYRSPFRSGFRPTFTVSFIITPVAKSTDAGRGADEYQPVAVDLMALHRLNDNLGQVITSAVRSPGRVVKIEGPLAGLLSTASSSPGLPGLIENLLQQITMTALGGAGLRGHRKKRVQELLSEARAESHLSSMLVQVDWTSTRDINPWEEFIRSAGDSAFRRAIHRVMFYVDSLDDASSLTSSRTTRFDLLQISNSMGDDLGGMTFFDPDTETKYLIYPSSREKYPNFSILRWLGFALYSDSALASLRSLLARLNAQLSSRAGLSRMTSSMEDAIENFGELYDLEIKRHIYRQEYERLKAILRIDTDYQQLTAKISTLTQAASLREQRFVNKLIVVLTANTLVVTAIAAVATTGQWSKESTIRWGAPSLILSTVLVSTLMDPVRRWIRRRL